MAETLPSSIRQKAPLDLGTALSETEALSHMRGLAAQNEVFTSLIGQGYSGTILPAVIQRNILENPAWYTAYTPYQPEISQGRLEALLNFQTMVCDLTGLDIANASLLDEATAAAEAMALAERAAQSQDPIVLCRSRRASADARGAAHPRRAAGLEADCRRSRHRPRRRPKCSAPCCNIPARSGAVRDLRPAIAALHAKGALAIVAADLLALTLLASPGELGADIAIGSAQRFGVPMGYGGPHAAFMAVRDAFKRSLPGRIVGLSVDSRGQPAYRLALQTREQHIRREKATSNICTAQVLLAVIASMYAVYHGPEGLTEIARTVHRRDRGAGGGIAQARLCAERRRRSSTPLTVQAGAKRDEIVARAQAENINLRHRRAARSASRWTRPRRLTIVEAVWRAFGGRLAYAEIEAGRARGAAAGAETQQRVPDPSGVSAHHSETEMLRYMRKLGDRDLALDRAMIPLGSCTMKLNATTEMIPLTWPEFGNLHPFAPREQASGYHALFARLEQWLCDITGYDAVSLQPNSGAQGEYAGLLAIRAYHAARGEPHRNVCLIPVLGARHQSGLRQHGRHGGGGGRLRRARQRRCRGSARQGGAAFADVSPP